MIEQPEANFNEDEPIKKWCSGCEQMKTLEAFSRQKGGSYGRRSRCKECISNYESTPEVKIRRKKRSNKTDWKIYAKERTVRDPEWKKHKYQLERARRQRNPEKYANTTLYRKYYRDHWIKRQYGLTEENYQELYLMQNGLCSICGQPQIEGGRKLDIDHDHTTGEVRGLLCNRCNKGIGFFRDDITILEKAIIYLQRFQK